MTIARAGAAYVENNNNIYAIAGVDGKNFLSSIERAKVNPDGSLSEWEVISQLPEPRGFTSAVVRRNRLYVIGGGNGPYGENLLNSVVSAELKPNGDVGQWRTESSHMLLPRRCAKVFVKKDNLYAVGGFGGNLLDSVEAAKFSANDTLEEWHLFEEKLNLPRYVNALKKVGNLVLAIGGHDAHSGKGIAQVEYLDTEQSSMTWQEASAMQQGRYAFAGVTVGERVFAMGGLSGTEYLDNIEYIEQKDIRAGKAWQASSQLPLKMANFAALNIDNRIYLFGGSTRSTYLNKVWYAKVNDQGKIGYWGAPEVLEKQINKPREEMASQLPNSGVVLERIASGDYVYMRVKDKNNERWLAAPINNIPVNSKVRFSEGVLMSNFYSKSLKRAFSTILFVGIIEEDK